MNAYAFNLRNDVLNSLLNNLVQIPTRLLLELMLEITRAYIAPTAWLSSWNFDRSIAGPIIDYTDPAYAGAVTICMFYAAQYGIFQNMVIHILSSLTNYPRKSAAMGGLFLGLLSSGTAISFGVDATAQPYENETAAYFAFTTLCWPILAFIAWKCVKETNYLSEEGVVAPIHVQKELGLEGKEIDTPHQDPVDISGEKGETRTMAQET